MVVDVDDFSRYSFVSFPREKSKAIKHLKSSFNRIQVEIGYPIIRIRSDKGREFDNVKIDFFIFILKELNMNIQHLELLSRIE